ncbi:hypothetical protein SCHPADRAFT_244650 [Schizopora paradoxa]|uniref:Uncharacterized protein n=1 Tax=Schizopora paradoxa TaxID=27342 RepID=A0A0H2S1Z9_9AGAM|nr:hypothetical protein SCHPADRAFT_244650 [Schizopora paradoxa]
MIHSNPSNIFQSNNLSYESEHTCCRAGSCHWHDSPLDPKYRPHMIKDATGRPVSADIMVISTDEILSINVDGRIKPFDTTGHRPILAGYDSLGRAHYLAVVRFKASEFVFTSVMDGGSTVQYADAAGIHVTYNFKVVMLRHDPCDLPSHSRRISIDALDQTGPLYWTKECSNTKPHPDRTGFTQQEPALDSGVDVKLYKDMEDSSNRDIEKARLGGSSSRALPMEFRSVIFDIPTGRVKDNGNTPTFLGFVDGEGTGESEQKIFIEGLREELSRVEARNRMLQSQIEKLQQRK